MTSEANKPLNFIQAIIADYLAAGKHSRVVTRFPPEPNGYPHIGHAKSICLNFGLAGTTESSRCHLRFDDTNPTTEDVEYVEAFKRDIRWLGFDWGRHLYHASDYFEQLYDLAVALIRKGVAYVDSLSEEEIRAYRGTVTEPGQPSPYRERTVEENLDLFQRMRAGEFAEGAHVLRAKIDMAAANMKMRDPLLYRIRHASHYRTGDAWCIYPMYDFAHCLSDALEHITHSLCTLEFENNRDIYDWVIRETGITAQPRQIEFARLDLSYTVLSKRKLLRLVNERLVDGWDDPRMPTIAGMRRRGYTPESIRDFCERIGVAKANSTVDFMQLEYSLRNDLNFRAPRAMGVLRPLKVVLTNYPEDREETLEAPSFPAEIGKPGVRRIPFARTLYIERDDFQEHPPKKYYRLAPGREVRLRYAYTITCNKVVKDETGEIRELRCTYDPATLGANPRDRKVQGIVHWVSARHGLPAEIRLYDRLFAQANPNAAPGGDFIAALNPESLTTVRGFVEPGIRGDAAGSHYQFERLGYFFSDPEGSRPERLVFNRTVGLKDSWAKVREETMSSGPEREKPKTGPSAAKTPEKLASPDKPKERDPELLKKLKRLTDNFGLSPQEAETLAGNDALAAFFEDAVSVHAQAKPVANWVLNELLQALPDRDPGILPFGGAELGELVGLVESGAISGKIGKEVLAIMIQSGGRPGSIVKERDLEQVSDNQALEAAIDDVLGSHPDELARYREGKKNLLGFFVGRVMKETRGKANPQMVNELLRNRLDEDA